MRELTKQTLQDIQLSLPSLGFVYRQIAVLKFKTIFHDVLNVIISLIAIILLNINSSE